MVVIWGFYVRGFSYRGGLVRFLFGGDKFMMLRGVGVLLGEG